MDKEDLERLWQEKENWWFGAYWCADDPRVVVPKRPKWTGWTINFAHPMAVPVLLLFFVIAGGPPLLMVALGVRSLGPVLLATAGGIVLLIVVSAYLASRTG